MILRLLFLRKQKSRGREKRGGKGVGKASLKSFRSRCCGLMWMEIIGGEGEEQSHGRRAMGFEDGGAGCSIG